MSRASYRTVIIAYNRVTTAADALMQSMRRPVVRKSALSRVMTPAEEQARAEIARTQWAHDPAGLVAGIGLPEYRARIGL